MGAAAAATTTASTSAISTMSRQQTTSRVSSGDRPITNAEMMKRAANYSLMEMEELETTLPAKSIVRDNGNTSVPGTIVTNSRKGGDSKRSSIRSIEEESRKGNSRESGH